MVDDLFFRELLLLGLLWLCVTLYWVGRRRQAVTDPAHRQPVKRSTRRSQAPKPFPGLTTKPLCAACEHVTQAYASLPPFRPATAADLRARTPAPGRYPAPVLPKTDLSILWLDWLG
jgi:hypothetical protein